MPDVSGLVKETNYDAKILDIDKKTASCKDKRKGINWFSNLGKNFVLNTKLGAWATCNRP